MTNAFADAGIRFDPFDGACADLAGTSSQIYRRDGGTRARMVADFLIGAHARTRADRLVTRDRGFFRRYFDGLDIIDPAR
jgi:predicted nucleic acid-binding protein